MTAPAAVMPPWNPPSPQELPEWRAQMVHHSRSMNYMEGLSQVIGMGRTAIFPVVADLMDRVSPEAVAATILAKMETRRLSQAELFSVDADMTALTLAAAAAPHRGKTRRIDGIPDYGLMAFDEPIGSYQENIRDVLSGTPAYTDLVDAWVTTPIVAVSWSPWSPRTAFQLTNTDGSTSIPTWMWNGPQGPVRLSDATRGIWINFYTCAEDRYALFPDDTIVSLGPDGLPMTVKDIREITTSTVLSPLVWNNESLLTLDVDWTEPEPGTTAQWLAVVYTAWQLMTQKGAITETTEIPRARAGRKRDRRDDITSTGTVRVVRVHPGRRPTRVQRSQDAEQSTGRAAPHYSCRFPVKLYRQDKCMMPHLHNTQPRQCWHDPDHIVLPHIKGPKGAPLKTREKVNLFDRMPD